jgi:hypothetical protein
VISSAWRILSAFVLAFNRFLKSLVDLLIALSLERRSDESDVGMLREESSELASADEMSEQSRLTEAAGGDSL